MNPYLKAYEQRTGKTAPTLAERLTPLFEKIAAGQLLPPRGQQAVDLGFVAHTFNDPHVAPALYAYYQWVITTYFQLDQVHELSAQLIGMAFTSMNVFKTDLPQPVTLNPWQALRMRTYPLMTKRAVVVENNGIFIWLAHRHPDWPLINQSGNDFNETYVQLMQSLEQRRVQFTYLGDLDSTGIRIADQLFESLSLTTIETFTAIQTASRVSYWLAVHGRTDPARTKAVDIKTPILKAEARSIHTLGQFVEQEQLVSAYEELIPKWLNS